MGGVPHDFSQTRYRCTPSKLACCSLSCFGLVPPCFVGKQCKQNRRSCQPCRHGTKPTVAAPQPNERGTSKPSWPPNDPHPQPLNTKYTRPPHGQPPVQPRCSLLSPRHHTLCTRSCSPKSRNGYTSHLLPAAAHCSQLQMGMSGAPLGYVQAPCSAPKRAKPRPTPLRFTATSLPLLPRCGRRRGLPRRPQHVGIQL